MYRSSRVNRNLGIYIYIGRHKSTRSWAYMSSQARYLGHHSKLGRSSHIIQKLGTQVVTRQPSVYRSSQVNQKLGIQEVTSQPETVCGR